MKLKDLTKIKWECIECGDIKTSDPLEHHKMDCCKCDKTGVDLETYSCRFMGQPKILEKIKPNFEELRLKPVWGTFGKDGNEPYKIISVSEMNNNHMKAILKGENPSEFMTYLIKEETKKRNGN